MAIGEKTVGGQTSAFPTSLRTFTAQNEENDGPVELAEFAQGGDINLPYAEIEALQAALGASPRGQVTVAGTTATIGGFTTVSGAGRVAVAGADLALTPSVLNYIFYDKITGLLAKSTVGWPATEHVPLATWVGTGTAVVDMRPHLPSTAVAPAAHAASHANGGSDEISVAGLSGLLADGQTPLAHKTSHENGGADEISVAGLSGVLADPQTPAAHAHAAGDITSGTLDDARVAASNVTQHRAALLALPALTQDHSTADTTHATRTAGALTDSSGGTPGTTIAAIPDPADTPADADALRDDLVTNVLPKIRDAIASLADQINKGRVDSLDSAAFLNSLVDALQ